VGGLTLRRSGSSRQHRNQLAEGLVREIRSGVLLNCNRRCSSTLPNLDFVEAFSDEGASLPSACSSESGHASVAAFAVRLRPHRQLHGNVDAPLPCDPMRVALAAQSYSANHMLIVVDEIIVFDIGPFRPGVKLVSWPWGYSVQVDVKFAISLTRSLAG
jgi:hypothetical protein